MKKIIILMMLASPMLMAVSCKKLKFDFSKQEMPPITQDGRKTFGLMFGKEIWVPKIFSLSYPNLQASYGKNGNDMVLNIVCRRTSPILSNYADDFEIRYKSADITTGTFELDDSNSSVEAWVTKADQTSKIFNLYRRGTLTITRWDMTTRIVSGTFSMDVKEKTSGETVSVTDGRFDLILGN